MICIDYALIESVCWTICLAFMQPAFLSSLTGFWTDEPTLDLRYIGQTRGAGAIALVTVSQLWVLRNSVRSPQPGVVPRQSVLSPRVFAFQPPWTHR